MGCGTSAWFCSVIIMGGFIVSDKAIAVQTLGTYPLCEASSALILPCPDSGGECLFVGDNEQRRRLFYFSIRDGGIVPNSQKKLKLEITKDEELSDIEALARISTTKIHVFGSHSRNSRCKKRENRRRFATVQISSEGATVDRNVQSGEVTCALLFGDVTSENTVLKAACGAIDNAEKAANNLETELQGRDLTEEQREQAKTRCSEIRPFNAEGAVAIHGKDRTDVWIGLRAPLLPEHPDQPVHKDLAILLHMINRESYAFDGVALLDMDGRGVRELTYTEEFIWVIAGSPEDKREPFQLRRFKKGSLESGKLIKPELVAEDLPTSSEGLAISGRTAYVVIDGDTGDDEDANHCNESSKYKVITLP